MTAGSIVIFSKRFGCKIDPHQLLSRKILNPNDLILRGGSVSRVVIKDSSIRSEKIKKTDDIKQQISNIIEGSTKTTKGHTLIKVLVCVSDKEGEILERTLRIHNFLTDILVNREKSSDLKRIFAKSLMNLLLRKVAIGPTLSSGDDNEKELLGALLEKIYSHPELVGCVSLYRLKLDPPGQSGDLEEITASYSFCGRTSNIIEEILSPNQMYRDFRGLLIGAEEEKVSYKTLNSILLKAILGGVKMLAGRDPGEYHDDIRMFALLFQGYLLDPPVINYIQESPEEQQNLDHESLKLVKELIDTEVKILEICRKYFNQKGDIINIFYEYLALTGNLYGKFAEEVALTAWELMKRKVENSLLEERFSEECNKHFTSWRELQEKLLEEIRLNLLKIFPVYDIIMYPSVLLIANVFPTFVIRDPLIIILQLYNFRETYRQLKSLIRFYVKYYVNFCTRDAEILKEIYDKIKKESLPGVMSKLLDIRLKEESRELKKFKYITDSYNLMKKIEKKLNKLINNKHLDKGKAILLIPSEHPRRYLPVYLTRLRHSLNVTHGFIPKGYVTLEMNTIRNLLEEYLLYGFFRYQWIAKTLLNDNKFMSSLEYNIKLISEEDRKNCEIEKSEVYNSSIDILSNLKKILNEYKDSLQKISNFTHREGIQPLMNWFELIGDFMPEILLLEIEIMRSEKLES